MEIQKFTEKDADIWERFVAGSNNGTIFHTLKFLSYHPRSRFKSHHIIMREKDTIIALFPAVKHENGIVSHRGASYGGFVCKEDLGIHKTCLMVDQLADRLFLFLDWGFPPVFRACGHSRLAAVQRQLFTHGLPLCGFQDLDVGTCECKDRLTR